MANEIYNTSWWGTALDTARTAGTNPDFFGSQMKLLTSEQDNLVTNGTFDTDSDWTKGTGWSIANGKAISDSSVAYQSLTQGGAISNSNGKTLKCKFTISDYQSGAVALYVSGFLNNSFFVSANGDYEYNLTVSSGTSGNIEFLTNSSGFYGSIDNVSVQLVRCELEDIEAKKCLADWIHTTALKDLNN